MWGTYLGCWVHTLDGEGYLPWLRVGYLPWMGDGVPTLDGGRGTYLELGMRGTYLRWEKGYIPWTGDRGTFLGWGGGGTYLG